MNPTEEGARWIELARRGDRAAFDLLARKHTEAMRGYIVGRLGPAVRSRIEVDDILQEVFLRAVRSLDRFRGETDRAFLGWLGVIAKHVILEATRRGRKETGNAMTEPSAPTTTPSRVLRREERFERLEAALLALKPEYRTVLRLARIEGLAIKEVARRMDRTPNATSMLLIRALEALKRRFGDTESLGLPDRRLRKSSEKNGHEQPGR